MKLYEKKLGEITLPRLTLNSSGASSKSWSSRFFSLTSFSTCSPMSRNLSSSTSLKMTAFFNREIAASNNSFLFTNEDQEFKTRQIRPGFKIKQSFLYCQTSLINQRGYAKQGQGQGLMVKEVKVVWYWCADYTTGGQRPNNGRSEMVICRRVKSDKKHYSYIRCITQALERNWLSIIEMV